MNEIKKPRKPLIYYYVIVMSVVALFNLLVMPQLAQFQVKEVDYSTFMTMTEERNIGEVDIQDTSPLPIATGTPALMNDRGACILI